MSMSVSVVVGVCVCVCVHKRACINVGKYVCVDGYATRLKSHIHIHIHVRLGVVIQRRVTMAQDSNYMYTPTHMYAAIFKLH